MTDLRDVETALFDLDQVEPEPAPRRARVRLVPAWTPPAEPGPESMPVPLPPLPEPGAGVQPAAVWPVPSPPLMEPPVMPATGDTAADTIPVPAEMPELRPAAPAWASALGVFDLETTGVDPSTARIVTAHVGLIDETGRVVERKEWIVDPGVPIPDSAAAVHGITDARAHRFGRSPRDVVVEVLAAIRTLFDRGFPLVVYNAPYDLTLLEAEADRLGLEPLPATRAIIDPLVIDKAVDRYRKGKRTLTAAAAAYGVELTDAHDAGADAIAAGRVAQAIARTHAADLTMPPEDLHDAQVAWFAEQSDRFEAYMRERHDPEFTCSRAWPQR